MRLLLFSTLLLILCTACDDSTTPDLYDLTIEVTPEEGGEVIPSTDLRLVRNQELTLFAVPTLGYSFMGWTGGMESVENPLSLTVTEDMNLTANFQIRNYPLDVTVAGNGTVIETVVTEKTDYDHGTGVRLNALPAENWEFVEWTGDVTGTEDVITITVEEEVNIIATFRFQTLDPIAVTKTNDTKIYMHYMPWFTSGPYDGSWSIHWTMDNRNPENIVNGRREIASHYYPLIGPYSSKDPDVIEYHLLLMKYSGVDAVLIDWYGTYDVLDYRDNLLASDALIDRVDEVGLEFGIVYEDRTTPNVVDAGLASTIIEAATTDFQYIFNNYYSNDQYVYINNAPLTLLFTPIEIETGSSWSQILQNAPSDPLMLSIWGESGDLGAEADGEYSWVFNGNNNHAQLLIGFYNNINSFTLGMGSAYPGFVDFYEEGGFGNIIGWEIAHNGTQTLNSTLALASQYDIEHLQLVTWNDFGEGTMMEPTEEFGYDFLTTLQAFTGVTYTQTELELIHNLYLLRKQHAGDQAIQDDLNQAFNYLVSLQVDEAATIINGLLGN
jgi:hypothetical protein